MRKTFLLCLFLSLCSPIYSREFPFIGRLNTDRVNLRIGPDINTPVIRTLEQGTILFVTGKVTEWFSVRLPEDVPLYIYRRLVSIQNGIARVDRDNINIRTGPGTNFLIIGRAKKTDTFSIIKIEDEWVRVKPSDELIGWIFGEFVKYEMEVEEHLKKIKLEQEVKDLFKQAEEMFNTTFKEGYDLKQIDVETIKNRYQPILSDKYPDGIWKQNARQRILELKLKLARKQYLEAKRKFEEKTRKLSGQREIPPPIATGIIDDLGMIFRRPGTHKLINEEGRLQYFLRSQKLNLNEYIYIPVAIWGNIESVQGWRTQVITVEKIKPLKEIQEE
jgi:uncharacterized protein YgiM (DUF1202 family)